MISLKIQDLLDENNHQMQDNLYLDLSNLNKKNYENEKKNYGENLENRNMILLRRCEILEDKIDGYIITNDCCWLTVAFSSIAICFIIITSC